MVGKRLGVLSACAVGLVLMIGVAQAGAAAPSKVLKFYDANSQSAGVGFNANDPNAIPPVGSSIVITVKLQNIGSQFGRPNGTTVGRVLLQCTVLTENGNGPDGLCSGIAHVPNGYFTFGGNGGFENSKVTHFDITGGVGPYADARGQINVVNSANGSSVATVTLYSV